MNPYKYKKHTNIFSFVNNTQNKGNGKIYIPFQCHGLNLKDKIKFNNNCFGCLSCILNDDKLKNIFFKKWQDDLSTYKERDIFFKGEIIKPLQAPVLLNHKKGYFNLKEFTSTNETENIQPWAGSILKKTSSNLTRISLEINVPYEKDDRDKRLDIGAISKDYFLGLETKTSLKSAINENERFIDQYIKYHEVIEDACKNHSIDNNLFILFGGNETDLLPPNNIFSTGEIGGLSFRFYDIVNKYNIKFISASALWGICLYFLFYGGYFSWDNFIKNNFDHKTYGLTSAGKIVFADKEFKLEPICF